MSIISGGRGSGKTEHLARKMAKNPNLILLVRNDAMVRRLPVFKGRVFTYADALDGDRLRGLRFDDAILELLIDDLEHFLQAALRNCPVCSIGDITTNLPVVTL